MGDAAHIILHRFRHRRFIFIAFSRVPRDDWKIFLLDAIDGALLGGDETAEIQKNTFLFRTNDGKMLILRGGNATFLWSGAIESWKSILWLNFNFFLFAAQPIDPSKDFTVDGINGFSSKKKKKKRRHRWGLKESSRWKLSRQFLFFLNSWQSWLKFSSSFIAIFN